MNKIFIFATVCLVSLQCVAQKVTWKPALDSMIDLYVSERNFSGVVMISKGGNQMYKRAVGYADREKQIANMPSTNFNIASVGKTITAVMIMQLVQEGKLRLTDTVSKLLPEHKIKNSDQMTVKHLLTHTSGMNNYMMHPKYEDIRKQLTTLSLVMPLVEDMPPTMAKPGDRFDYSNSGFITLGRIIEKITGKDYRTNLRDRIFNRAGMTNSYIHYPATFQAPREAVPYMVFTKTSFRNGIADEFPAYSDGGMQSNVEDMTKFANALLKNKILSQEMRDQLWKAEVKMGRSGTYALGWIDNENPYGKKIISHDGGGKGFSTDVKIVVEDEYVIVVMINNRLNPRDISNNILKLIYKGEYDRPAKPLENIVFEKVEAIGWETTMEQFPAILASKGLDKVPSVWTYIQLMEMFADAGKMDISFKIFDMATKEFPKSSGPYNVAAQIYLQKGDKDEAKKHYQKALEVNPDDWFAKAGLEKL